MPRPSWIPRLPPLCSRPESGFHPLLSARSGLPAGSRGCPGDDERRINGAQGRQRCLPAALPAGSHCHRAAAARCAALRVGARSGVGLRTSVHPRRGCWAPLRLGRAQARPGRGPLGVPCPGTNWSVPGFGTSRTSPLDPRPPSAACSGTHWPGAASPAHPSAGLSDSLGSSLWRHLVPKCPLNCGLVPAFQPWTAMAVCLLPVSETLYHRSPALPKGGTGSKPSTVCRGQSPLSGAWHLVLCVV